MSVAEERVQAAEMRRSRLIAATAEVLAEEGPAGASVAAVARRAALPQAAFGELFESVEDCLTALLHWMLGRATALAEEAFQHQESWREGVVAALEAILRFLDAEPLAARACLVSGGAGIPSIESQTEHLHQFASLIDRARAELSLERQPPPGMAEATVAAVLGILRSRLLGGDAPPFTALLGQLADVVVAPYLGPSAAARAARDAERRLRAGVRKAPASMPRIGAEVPRMLLHGSAHRMRSCLLYLADHPGASNQEVGQSIEISHVGQTSALLARLHGEGLLIKQRGGPGRPNAWSLSARGAAVLRALSLR